MISLAMSSGFTETVSHSNVVGSMDIATAVGAERLRELMNELFGRVAAVVQRFGGTAADFTGGGLGSACLEKDDIRESQNFVSEMARRYDGHR